MFRSSTIIRELALNLAKVIFMLKHSVELRRYLLCGCVAACYGGICHHSTDTAHINKHDGTIPVILARHRLRLPDDGSCVNRNMSEQLL